MLFRKVHVKDKNSSYVDILRFLKSLIKKIIIDFEISWPYMDIRSTILTENPTTGSWTIRFSNIITYTCNLRACKHPPRARASH